MSQVALSLMGEGDCFYNGERMPTRDAMAKAGIPVPGLLARDGLAAINGSNLITGMSCLLLYDAERWTAQAEIAAAMSLEALMAKLADKCDSMYKGVEDAVNKLGDNPSQKDLQKVQMMMDKYKQMTELLSNMQKDFDEMNMSIIRNIKG